MIRRLPIAVSLMRHYMLTDHGLQILGCSNAFWRLSGISLVAHFGRFPACIAMIRALPGPRRCQDC